MKRNKHLGLLFTVIFICCNGLAQHTKVTVRAIDYDTRTAITNAFIGLSVDMNIKPGWGWGAGKPNRYQGVTDSNGICVLYGKGNGGTASVYAKHDGYYGSSGYIIHFAGVHGILWRKWQPWNPTIEVALKRIVKPVPLYQRTVRVDNMPKEGEPIGFDLIEGDWVGPHGEGKQQDLVFTLSRKPEQVVKKVVVNRTYDEILYDITLTIRGGNEGDGFIEVPIPVRQGGSSLRMPREAPAEGYEPAVTKRNYRDRIDKPTRHNVDENMNYFFRVRTEPGDEGRVKRALYGKIHGDFRLDHNGRFGFTYYLNPTPNDRNLEFDRARNLFDLPAPEQVSLP